MSAITSIVQVTGTAGSPSLTTITNLRNNTDDTANPGLINPLVKPVSGTNYGFWKTVYLNAVTTPQNAINNVKLYSNGSLGWTGVTLNVGYSATYNQATGTVGITGNASGVATVDVQTYTSGSPLSVAGSIANPNTGKISDYVVFQAAISTSAVAGNLPAGTITFSYDET